MNTNLEMTPAEWTEQIEQASGTVAILFAYPESPDGGWIAQSARQLEFHGTKVLRLDAGSNAELMRFLDLSGAPALVATCEGEEAFRLEAPARRRALQAA